MFSSVCTFANKISAKWWPKPGNLAVFVQRQLRSVARFPRPILVLKDLVDLIQVSLDYPRELKNLAGIPPTPYC
ncbi:hypothetical protein CGBL_0120270 [Corynebacterium glutamicum]|nr:hypothetical protein CGBL_0120270 [Corynebacterium glutamicum]